MGTLSAPGHYESEMSAGQHSSSGASGGVRGGEGSVLEPSRGEARIGTEAGEHVSACWFLFSQSIFTAEGQAFTTPRRHLAKGKG